MSLVRRRNFCTRYKLPYDSYLSNMLSIALDCQNTTAGAEVISHVLHGNI